MNNKFLHCGDHYYKEGKIIGKNICSGEEGLGARKGRGHNVDEEEVEEREG